MRAVSRVLIGLSVLGLTLAIGAPAKGAATAPCRPDFAPVDVDANEAARCLAATLDDWKHRQVMGVGQQIDVQEMSRVRATLDPLLPLHPAVVGFDLTELLDALDYFDNDPVPYLADLAHSGIVLTVTWGVNNPVTGVSVNDRSWTDLAALLDDSTPASRVFWPQYDRILGQVRRFQDAGVSLIFRPLNEASGGWFWWGRPDPATYRALYARLQSVAWAQGIHNLLWGYSANPKDRDTDDDPVPLLPAAVDIVGIDTYDNIDERPWNRTPLTDYRRLQALANRMAIMETGPYNSPYGTWDPRVITDTLRDYRLYASYAMLWRDDPKPGPIYQISSLDGGLAWLASCPDGLCSLAQPGKRRVTARR